ncbi:MAG: hypothetical protein KBD64_07790 [Gammaproteobacteria bacterium]|nr:hypothetical protein [Gammaproteobacteria bacterium]
MYKLKYNLLIATTVALMSNTGLSQQATSTCGDGIIDTSTAEVCDLGSDSSGVSRNIPANGCSTDCKTVTPGWTCLNDNNYDSNVVIRTPDPTKAPSKSLSMVDLWKLLSGPLTYATGQSPATDVTHISNSDAGAVCTLTPIPATWASLCEQYVLDINRFKDLNNTIPISALPAGTQSGCVAGTQFTNFNLNTKAQVTNLDVKC